MPGTDAPLRVDGLDEAAVHTALGPWLARLHALSTGADLPAWPVVDRLRALLASPPPTCPAPLVADVARLVEPWFGLVVDGVFVHGDWGSANVLVAVDEPLRIVAVIDLEDAHRGDPAEDFAWPVLAGPGPDGRQHPAMAAAYGRPLGAHAEERLALAGAEKCLDVLGWRLDGEEGRRFFDRCRQTLVELVDGVLPVAP